jgi:hypothetical protein
VSADRGSSPLRFVAGEWRVEQRRAIVALRGLAGRVGGSRAYLAWPDAREPRQIVPAGRPAVAAWIRRTFEPEARRRPDAATWSALRSRSLVVARGPGSALIAAEQALGRPLAGPVLGCVSDSGHPLGKLLCFVFEENELEPALVVKGIPRPGEGERLLAESRFVESMRERLPGQVADALPLAPVWNGRVAADDFVVEPPDLLAVATGLEDRGAALGWLRRFQEETAHERWGTEADLAAAGEMLDYAAAQAGLPDATALRARWRELWDELSGGGLERCAVHGDFWRGNIAVEGARMRVYDWEWAAPSGQPLFDLWSYELGALRGGAGSPEAAAAELAAASGRVEAELEARGLDHRLARALLAPITAEVGYRVRRVRGIPPDHEDRPRALLLGAARLIAPG